MVPKEVWGKRLALVVSLALGSASLAACSGDSSSSGTESSAQMTAIQNAGKIVSPVKPAADDDIFCARRPNRVQHRLHPDALIIFGFQIPTVGLVRDRAAVEPDIPGDIVRLIIQIKKDGWIVCVNRRAGFPEHQTVGVGHGMLADIFAPFVAV